MKNRVLNLFLILIFLTKLTPNTYALEQYGTMIGATYYGGYFDEEEGSWYIDNNNQCTRVGNGEFTAESLGAKIGEECNDDNGLGYIDSEPLHNRVSFAELSTDYLNPDYAALGKLPYGTKLEINYNGKCLIAEKLDVGIGGTSVNGYHRSIDLWWQTAKTLGFENGFDTVKVTPVSSMTPVTALGKLTKCLSISSEDSVPNDVLDTPKSLGIETTSTTISSSESKKNSTEDNFSDSNKEIKHVAIRNTNKLLFSSLFIIFIFFASAGITYFYVKKYKKGKK